MHLTWLSSDQHDTHMVDVQYMAIIVCYYYYFWCSQPKIPLMKWSTLAALELTRWIYIFCHGKSSCYISKLKRYSINNVIQFLLKKKKWTWEKQQGKHCRVSSSCPRDGGGSQVSLIIFFFCVCLF